MEKIVPLCELAPGEQAYVSEMWVTGSAGKRLGELGLRKGTEVVCLQRAPSGDPTAYGFKGIVLALRRSESSEIWMEGREQA